MNKIVRNKIYGASLLLLGFLPGVFGQNSDPMCSPGGVQGGNYPAAAFFNYGAGIDMRNTSRSTDLTIGQMVIGSSWNTKNTCDYGYWGQYLIPPFEPTVSATQGDLLDRIQVSWTVNPLGALPSGGFNIYRDGSFLATVGNNIRTYNDFNVIPGRPYIYTVRGNNVYGEGRPGTALGFQVPNGVVTGYVQTLNGSPVPDALVTLMPMQGFSARFGPMDGAFAEADSVQTPFLPASGADWTLMFWIKTDSATANAGILKLSPYPLHFRALESAGGHEGIEISNLPMGAPFLSLTFPDSTKNAWHHVALSFDGSSGQGRAYLDGTLVDIAPMISIPLADTLSLGSRTDIGGWAGRLDELRIYHRRLDELELDPASHGTASSLTPDLTHYWKMDEELGLKSYDILKRHKLYFCGVAFDPDRPPVRTSGITNQSGYYRIESASYGTGTTFLAEPFKNFYLHRALKFVRDEQDYATLPDFSLTPKSTLELWVNSAGPDGVQCLLSKKWGSNDFRLMLQPNGLMNELRFYLNGTEYNFGDLGMGYQHLAFTIDSSGSNRTVAAYKNGNLLGSNTFAGITGDWSDNTQEWILGARESGGFTDHYGGLIDEIAVYDSTLSASAITAHAQAARNPQEKGLRIYFALDEGSGNRLSNSGSVLTDPGMNHGAAWTPFSPNQATKPHVFTPGTRQVTLNPSVTSVDLVDFTDRSTVAVSGFVRYAGTDCFAENVEILVNGERFNPPIFTDSTGKFVIDFDPGTTATLTPKFEDHQFVPAFWDVTNVVSPIAGILFTDITTRKISGQVAGGLCKKSVIKDPGTPQGTVCQVKVRTLDGCLERVITIDNPEGEFLFENLPPAEMTVAVVEHSDPTIKTFFQVKGGATVDLAKTDTIVDFIYFSMPEVEIVSGLDPIAPPNCTEIVLEQFDIVTLNIRLKEQYVVTPSDDGVCYIDSASFHIINGFADEVKDTVMSNGNLLYKFRVGTPNPTPPYRKLLQIISSTLDGNEGEYAVQAIVTGIRSKENTFTTKLPEVPSIVLRDPPGDGSYAYMEKNEQFCRTASVTADYTVGGGGGVTIDNGPNVKIVAAPGGVGKIIEVDTKFGVSVEGTVTYQKITDNSFEVCTSMNQRFSTSGDEVIVGGERGGDVFVGGGINMEFGFADAVTFDVNTCTAADSVVLAVAPREYATTFMYSQFHIENNVLRYLNSLAEATTDSAELSTYTQSIAQWEKILADNAAQKANADFVRNISFDAGFNYEYSETSDTTESNSVTENVNSSGEVTTFFEPKLDGIGLGVKLKFVFATVNGGTDSEGQAKGVTTGYVLADNDPGDAFTVDVGMDSVYHTPVFNLKAGQSSCPWEPGTANREGVLLSSLDGPIRTDVPANEAAVFHFTLGNLSASNEDWTYGISANESTNPDGAVIKLNGSVLNSTHKFIIPYGTSTPITITVERGPVAYDYDSLVVAMYSECEYERNVGLSLPLDGDPNFYSSVALGVHFLQPCSEVNINVPEQDWVIFPNPITPGPDDEMRITVSGYDTIQEDFQLVRLQYRRSDGDGAWINITPLAERYNPNWSGYVDLPDPKPPVLQPTFTQFFWNTVGLADGPYEIRAVAVCSGDATDRPGYSQVIKGRIDREPPSLVGVPEPADGVYNVGDEISFTFNKHVNCNKLIPADLFNANNVGLYDATTGQLIDIDVTCFENKIVLDPNFQNEFFENRILRAELHDIEDKTGNKRPFLKWEFYVDRNELAWLTDSIGMTKYEDETKTVIAKIHNRGGYPVPFKIKDLPDWVHVVPDTGVLAANEIRDIRFEVDSSLAFGHWTDSITLHTVTGQNPFFMGGDERLPLAVRVICRPPDWDMDAGLYENTMNMVLKLDIQGAFSTDVEDIVAAYIDDELRGRAYVQYVAPLNAYFAYLTIYGAPADVLKPVRLEIWDASACLRYGLVQENFDFQPDVVIGSSNTPQVVHTNSLILREVPLGNGWNWISFNLAFPDNSLDAALVSLKYPQNGLIKNQSAFATYSGANWVGSLAGLGNTDMYVYRTDQADTLKMLGNLIDPLTTNIPIVAGWNWIGYIPNYALPIDVALSSLSPQPGDLIKSQISFAQYTQISPLDFRWIGNLKYMQPPNGYQIRLAAPGTLTYPPKPAQRPEDLVAARGDANTLQNYWTVNPAQYEYNMTLIGMLAANNANATTATMELGAFAGNEVRGSAQAIYLSALDAYQFFLTSYANQSGEQLHYKLYDSATGQVQDLTEKMYFTPNLHQGSIQDPVPFHLQTSNSTELSQDLNFDIQPNPFHTETMFHFALPYAQEIALTVSDASGREVSALRTQGAQGWNALSWNGQSNGGQHLNSGVYYVRLQTESGSVTKKLVLQRLP